MIEVNELPTTTKQLYVIEVSAEWCGHCRQMQPQLEQAEKDNLNLVFLKLDADKISDELIKELDVNELPHIFAYKNGKVLCKYNEKDGTFSSWLKFVQW